MPKRKNSSGEDSLAKVLKPEQIKQLKIFDVLKLNCFKSFLIDNQLAYDSDAVKIDNKDLIRYQKQYEKDEKNRLAKLAISNSFLDYIACIPERFNRYDFVFNTTCDREFEASNQSESGRCWIFSCLNYLRKVMDNMNDRLDKKFQLSHNFIFFYDKIERSLEVLNYSLRTKNKKLTSNRLSKLEIDDGGCMPFFINLIQKYGIVPYSNYTENLHSSATSEINKVLNHKIIEYCAFIRKVDLPEKDINELIINTFMPEIYKLMVNFMGQPPTTFTWNNKHAENSDKHPDINIPNLTPLSFYKQFIQPHDNLDSMLYISLDPTNTKKLCATYYFNYSNVPGTGKVTTIFLPLHIVKQAVVNSLKDEIPIVLLAETEKINHEFQIMDDKAFDYDAVLNTKLMDNKADLYMYQMEGQSHAMLLDGVDYKNGKYIKWRVENSWGSSGEDLDSSRLVMTDSWFDRYVYGCCIQEKYFNKTILKQINKLRAEPIKFPKHENIWAQECRGCKRHGKMKK